MSAAADATGFQEAQEVQEFEDVDPSAVLAPEVVEEIVAGVWEAFVTDLEPPFPTEPPGLDDIGEHPGLVSGSVSVSGTWRGAVTVALSRVAADALAGLIFGLAPGEAGDEDLADAIGELVNIVGGNVKASAGEGASLGLPQVHLGIAHRPADLRELFRTGFAWQGEPLEIIIWHELGGER